MSNIKSQINNNCSNGITNLCCQPPPSTPNNVKPLMEQNIPKKTIKIIDAPNGKGFANSLDNSSDSSSADQPKMKIIEDENNMHGIKLTDIALPHISVKTLECKKTDKPTTTIIIYKPKNSNRAPTAKVIMTKVRFVSFLLRPLRHVCTLIVPCDFTTTAVFLTVLFICFAYIVKWRSIIVRASGIDLRRKQKLSLFGRIFNSSKCHTVN